MFQSPWKRCKTKREEDNHLPLNRFHLPKNSGIILLGGNKCQTQNVLYLTTSSLHNPINLCQMAETNNW
jgi:hypothetical protein